MSAALEQSARSAVESGLSRVERNAAPIISALDDLKLAGQIRTLKHIRDDIDGYLVQFALNHATASELCVNGD